CSIVFGGSSGDGRELVELFAARGDRVLTTARDIRDLEALQRDCALRFGAKVNIEAADFSDAAFDPDAFVDRCANALGHITHVFLLVGAISSEDKAIPNHELMARLTMVNYIRPGQLLSAACKHFEKNGYGHAMVFSSVA